MKKVAICLLSIVLTLFCILPASAFASEKVSSNETPVINPYKFTGFSFPVYINGMPAYANAGVDMDNEPVVILRSLMLFLGYDVEWDAKRQVLKLSNDEDIIRVYIGANYCEKNGSLVYVKKPVTIESETASAPASFLKTIFNLEVVEAATELRWGFERKLTLTYAPVYFDDIQKDVDKGNDAWRTDPKKVASNFVANELGFSKALDSITVTDSQGIKYARVKFTDGSTIKLDLYQPSRRGTDGIWAVERWYDTNNKKYQVRDLSNLPPLFYNDDTIPAKYRDKLKTALTDTFTKIYSPNYNILGFDGKNIKLSQNGNNVEITLTLTMIMKNFEKNPDTVDYIKKAKEDGSKEYETLYREYSLAKESNLLLKITGTLKDGDLTDIKIFDSDAVSGIATAVELQPPSQPKDEAVEYKWNDTITLPFPPPGGATSFEKHLSGEIDCIGCTPKDLLNYRQTLKNNGWWETSGPPSGITSYIKGNDAIKILDQTFVTPSPTAYRSIRITFTPGLKNLKPGSRTPEEAKSILQKYINNLPADNYNYKKPIKYVTEFDTGDAYTSGGFQGFRVYMDTYGKEFFIGKSDAVIEFLVVDEFCAADIDGDGEMEFITIGGAGSGIYAFYLRAFKLNKETNKYYIAYKNDWWPTSYTHITIVKTDDKTVHLYTADRVYMKLVPVKDYGKLLIKDGRLIPEKDLPADVWRQF